MLTVTADSWDEFAAGWRQAWLARGKAAPRARARLVKGVSGPVVVVWLGQIRTAVDAATGAPLPEPR